MTDGRRKTGGEPVFDTDRAWDRFESLARREPVPAFWSQAEESQHEDASRIQAIEDGNQNNHKKDGAVEMKQTEASRVTLASPDVGAGARSAARHNGPEGTWRTERPARRRLRRLAVGAVAAAMVVSLFTTPLGDRALAAMQQTFRIQKVVGLEISADDMATISGLLDQGSPEGDRSFNLAQYGTLTHSGGGKVSLVTWEEAEQRMGAPLLKLEKPTTLTYQADASLTLNLNVKAANRLLTRLGGSTTLPAEADGKTIKLNVPDGVVTEGTLSGKTVRLLQYGKPELTVEDGIDAAAVRKAVLGLPVLPDSLRTKLAAIGDWQSTLPVPAREGATTSLRLGGHDMMMTVDGTKRLLFWLDGDRMALLGGDMKDFPTEASFQQAAEELIQP